MSLSRRNLLKATASGIAMSSMGVPLLSHADSKTVKIGMNIPMTGDYAPWGLPGLYGCEIIANNINADGGINVGGENYMIEMVSYDHGYDTEKAVQGYKKMVLEDEVKLVMMLGGSTVASVLPFSERRKVLTSTLLPSDITPESEYLIAPCESHPLYNVTGVEWLAENFPEAKTAVIVTNNDVEYGMQSAATYQSAFEVAGIEVLDVNLHGFDVTDFAPIVSSALAKNPDIFCMATSFYVTPLMEQLFHQDFKGKIISCTLDYYDEIIAKTSKEFVNGTIFQFPDFDDPALADEGVSFPDPAGFDAAFREAHPNDWSAVSWEYPSILVQWVKAAEACGSVESTDVLAEMKSHENPDFVFGGGKWWGSQLWGLDNAVVGRWPVVVVEDGKARIQEFKSVSDWLNTNSPILVENMKDMGLRTV